MFIKKVVSILAISKSVEKVVAVVKNVVVCTNGNSFFAVPVLM